MLASLRAISRRRLRGSRGAVALEAILSIIFLFGAFYAMWGVALIVYNKSQLATATQLSAQAALLTYDRSTYRGRDVDDLYERAAARATRIAGVVFRENTCGMLRDQFSSGRPLEVCGDPSDAEIPGFELEIECAPRLGESGWSAEGCHGSGDPDEAKAIRARVRAEAQAPYFFLTPFRSSDGLGGGDPERRLAGLEASSSAYGYGAALPPEDDE